MSPIPSNMTHGPFSPCRTATRPSSYRHVGLLTRDKHILVIFPALT